MKLKTGFMLTPGSPETAPHRRQRDRETVFCPHRPNRLNEAITNEVSELVCFRLQGENAVRRVDNLAGRSLGAPDLPLGTFAAVNLDSGGVLRGKLF